MSINLNKELFQKLNELLSKARPTKVLKRGNAFSIVELNNEEDIIAAFKAYTFTGLNIYGVSGDMLRGESFYKDRHGKELEFESRIQMRDKVSLKIAEFELNLLDNEIFLKIN